MPYQFTIVIVLSCAKIFAFEHRIMPIIICKSRKMFYGFDAINPKYGNIISSSIYTALNMIRKNY